MAQAANTDEGFNLDSVLYELQGVDFPAHKWRRLANSLRVASVVDNIDADHRDVAGKLQAVVSHWIGNTTQHNQWTTLVEAASMCDERRRAKKLAAIVGVEYTPAQARIPGSRRRPPTEHDDEPSPKRRKQPLPSPLISDYVDRLKKVYQAPPPTWNPLPMCEHIKLAMIRVKGKRHGKADETMVRRKMREEVEAIVADKVPIELDKIFDSGLFAEERQVILVEGGPGMGKTTLAYHFGQEWAKGNLKFHIVAHVSLCNIAITPASTLADLLLLACESKKETIEEILESSPKLLLVLDGWDEATNQIRQVSFLTNILQSLSPQSKILITSRSDSSVGLHGLANRVEILGFNEESIHEYFKKALSTELEDDKLEGECEKLREHFRNHPVIQSCCSSPLNAAILAHLFLTEESLPSTRHELFCMLVLSRINRELQIHSSQESTEFASLNSGSLIDLPCEPREKLHYLCKLAFEGEKQNKVIFSQKELVSLNLPAVISALGLLQIDDSYSSTGELTTYYYFIHHSIQELLAAYHISRLGEVEQVQIFRDLLNKPRFSDVLQFYAAFTALTNKGVQKLISGSTFSSGSLLTLIRCFF